MHIKTGRPIMARSLKEKKKQEAKKKVVDEEMIARLKYLGNIEEEESNMDANNNKSWEHH